MVRAHAHKRIQTSNKNILDVAMEKEQKQEFGWRVYVLPIPAFHCILCTYNTIRDRGSDLYVGIDMVKNYCLYKWYGRCSAKKGQKLSQITPN